MSFRIQQWPALAGCSVWDSHACMPLRLSADEFLPQLERHRQAGARIVSLNVHFGESSWHEAFKMLAVFRHWIARHAGRYRLIDTVSDIEDAVAAGELGIIADIEGGMPVEPHPGLRRDL